MTAAIHGETVLANRAQRTATKRPVAIILAGGIGDYMHYLARLDSLLHIENLAADEVTLFVESTVPHMVRSLFIAAVPELELRFTPPQIHWTKTHPLLDVMSDRDRVNRPAHCFVEAQGYSRVVDWFLPFCCDELQETDTRLMALMSGTSSSAATLVISLRNKGFLWWPARKAIDDLRELGAQHKLELILLGTPVERPPWIEDMTTAPDVLAGLRMSVNATLFVGTDTGFATIRELLARPNVYCVSEYWFEHVMLRYGYISDARLAASGSRIAYDAESCADAVAAVLTAQRKWKQPERRPTLVPKEVIRAVRT
jgi:hypothetical protein